MLPGYRKSIAGRACPGSPIRKGPAGNRFLSPLISGFKPLLFSPKHLL